MSDSIFYDSMSWDGWLRNKGLEIAVFLSIEEMDSVISL